MHGSVGSSVPSTSHQTLVAMYPYTDDAKDISSKAHQQFREDSREMLKTVSVCYVLLQFRDESSL